ncbi:MAG: hypothetical protein KKB13_11135 [Chloroflexi bacterium]|nr:hypothetical protein [Chloroflexota bacterium]
MSRLRSVSNAGFVQTPPAHFRRLAAQLQPCAGSGSWLLDPCAGRGKVGRALANRWNLKFAAVEINADRGSWARHRADHAVIGDALEVTCGHEQFSVVFSNPPYDVDGEGNRMEWRFLRRYRDALVPDGILVYIVPGYRIIEDRHIAPHLVQYYQDLRVYTIPDPNPYGQVVVYAVRRAKRDQTVSADGLRQLLLAGPPVLPDTCPASAPGYSPASAPGTCADPLPIPAHPRQHILLRGTAMDPEQLRRDGLAAGVTLAEQLKPPVALQTRVVVPLKRRHLASVIEAGLLDNGRVGDWIMRGSIQKGEAEVVGASSDPDTRVTRTHYTAAITLFNPQTGEFQVIDNDEALETFMAAYTSDLVDIALRRFQPIYQFDYRSLPEAVRRTIARCKPGEPLPGKPRGLWPGQRHVLAALYRAMTEHGRKAIFVEAEMGYGKSLVGSGFLALFHASGSAARQRQAGWFVTEAHLVDQMVAEARSTVPWAQVTKIETLADAIAFVKQGRQAGNQGQLRIAVLSKQRLKDGCGWVPAVLKRTAYRRISLEALLKELPPAEAEDIQRRVTDHQHVVNDYRAIPPDVCRLMRRQVTVYRCPDCGRVQVYPTGTQKGTVITNDDGYFCQSLRQCCSAVVQEEKKTVLEGCGSFLAQQGRNLGRVKDIPPATTGLGRVAPPTVRYQRVLAVPTESTTVLRAVDRWPAGNGDYVVELVEETRPIATRTRHVVQAPTRTLVPDPARPGEYMVQWTDAQGQPVTVAKSTPPPMPRLSVSEWLRAKGRDQVGAVVFDEVHGYSAEDTNAGYALGEMLSMADQAMLMTGTLHSGYARSVFYLAHRVDAAFRQRYRYRDVGAFVRTYGYEERRYTDAQVEVSEHGHTRWSTRTRTSTKEIPGVSPALVAEFLGYTIFTSLSDLGVTLPPIHYRLTPVGLDPEHLRAYKRYRDDCYEALRAGAQSGVKLAGSFLHTLSSYAIAPWRPEQLLDKDGGEWASAPSLELVCPVCGHVQCESQCAGRDEPRVHRARLFASEQALLDELQAQVDRGRRTVGFLDYTGTRDIVTPRLVPLCLEHGLRAIFCAVQAQKRGAWIAKHAPGCDVMFVNTGAASVGLNLIQFQTAVFYQPPYSGTVFQQAPARLRRPTQTESVEIVYLNALETLIEQALALMFKKRGAAGDFRGESLEGSLGELTASGSFLDELVERALANRAADLEALFARFARADMDRDLFLGNYDLTIDGDDPPPPVVETLTVEALRRTVPLPPLVAVQLKLF